MSKTGLRPPEHLVHILSLVLHDTFVSWIRPLNTLKRRPVMMDSPRVDEFVVDQEADVGGRDPSALEALTNRDFLVVETACIGVYVSQAVAEMGYFTLARARLTPPADLSAAFTLEEALVDEKELLFQPFLVAHSDSLQAIKASRTLLRRSSIPHDSC